MALSGLKRLVYCHSTPGDESEVFAFLLAHWRLAGWQTRSLGRYAVLAERPALLARAPTVLLCAHADSPGYIVSAVTADGGLAIPLGSPAFPPPFRKAVLKSAIGKSEVSLSRSDLGGGEVTFPPLPGLQRGDRLAFKSFWRQSADGLLRAPFLDNRVGCFLLTRLATALPSNLPVNIVLAVTGGEEFTGFGASVLARAVPADLVLCLDVTYANRDQGVNLGGGPVLTLSDRSVLIGPEVQQTLAELGRGWGLPLQIEVYNYSGTDAKAFPLAGNPALVLPLLIASKGNHSPRETIATADLQSCEELLLRLCSDSAAQEALRAAASIPGVGF